MWLRRYIAQARLEKTLLGEIVRSFEHVIQPDDGAYVEIRLDLDAIQALQLDIDVISIMNSIIKDVKASPPQSPFFCVCVLPGVLFHSSEFSKCPSFCLCMCVFSDVKDENQGAEY